MSKHIAILQKWDQQKTFSILMQFPMDKEAEARRALEALNKEAYQKHFPVEYKIEELPGSMPESAPSRKPKNLIINPQG